MYFQYLSMILGVYLTIAGLWILLRPESYRLLGKKWIPEKRPVWYGIASLGMMMLVGYTWLRYFQAPNALAWGLSVVLSVSLAKSYFLLFRYDQFKQYATAFLDQPNSLLQTLAALFFCLGVLLTAIALALSGLR